MAMHDKRFCFICQKHLCSCCNPLSVPARGYCVECPRCKKYQCLQCTMRMIEPCDCDSDDCDNSQMECPFCRAMVSFRHAHHNQLKLDAIAAKKVVKNVKRRRARKRARALLA